MVASSSFPVIGQAAQFLPRAGNSISEKSKREFDIALQGLS